MRARLRSLTPPTPAAKAPRGRSSGPRDLHAANLRQRDQDDRVGPDTFERRMRETDGPTDMAHYACVCGFQFSARVDTTVACPHCGAGQAW